MVSIVKRKPIQGVCTVLAMVKRERERERERESEKLASTKLGMLSNPMRSEPMWHDA
jgi:hypothetical protein